MRQVDEYMEFKIVNNEDLKLVKSVEIEIIQDVKVELIKNVNFEFNMVADLSVVKVVELEFIKDIELIIRKYEVVNVIESRILLGEEEQKLFKDIEEMKLKFYEFELK